jgi:trimeric autotransporter adhesin
MALILKDRVKETTAVTSTGTATLLGAVTGYQSFSVIGNGNTCYYTIASQTANEWEVGIGTYTSPDQLSRDTVLSSSNSGSLVNFSAGTKDVFVTQPSSKAVYTDASNIVNTSGNGANTVAFTNINASNIVTVSGTISTNAANATDITNKQYVDGLFSTGISYHDPVLVEEDAALNAVYVQPNGAGNGVGATLTNNGANAALVVDGISVSNTARILVYAQANAVQNGVYTVTNPGNATAQWVLTRATDADTFGLASPNKLGQGDAFFVQDGDTGAGRTYICNTTGTITFGSTNITFAQISSAQIYAAGTGLNLANLTFSIANTAVTAATYGNDGNIAQITVNAQGQLTNAANVAINASSITVGTLANARTTASDANGASTIVSRDSTGSFTANTITATTVNATTGNFTNITANASGLTDINASNITSGTISNARTTASDANGASTIVTRDANGAFSAGNVTAANFIGAGTTITSINASNISSGTIANARTTAASANGASTIVSRDSGGNFSANTVTAAVIGDISGGSNINASNISSGTIDNARTTASSSNGSSTIVLRDAGGAFAAGAITGTSFSGNGSALTAINASAITTGTLDNARTSAASANGASTIVARDAGGNFSANTITATTFSGAHSGNGASLTDINASNISSGTVASARISGSYTGITGVGTLTAGTWNANVIANAYTSAATANGASTIVLRGTSGEFSAGAITSVSISGNGVALTAINASNIASGTIANVRTTASDANGASTIVARDANGSFTANVGTFTTVSGAGGGLTSINASNISSGTVATARLGSGTANASTFLRGDQTYAVPASGVTITNDTSTNATYYPIFTTASTGSISAANVSTTELTFNPGTNELTAPVVTASYGMHMNPATLSTSYTIPASFNAVSAGPVTIANSVTITVSTGSSWVVV